MLNYRNSGIAATSAAPYFESSLSNNFEPGKNTSQSWLQCPTLLKFYLARYQELSPFLRALVNTTLATSVSIRRHPDKMIVINRAKTILADLRTWPKEDNSDNDLDFLQKTINDAEATAKEQMAAAEAQAQASQDKKDVEQQKGNQPAEGA
ncbi:hypothetical protein LTR10_015175 [Elasticomyces elasticus]|uniref:Uncharacterized protein n=1 Tax=Exophiala sideris TaxID=1016849 RepID=A0ABR0JE16_9EURO|nr:hypothetical protein LTR10_015175 [Elasticomyces elasticus]KAK5032649.1 hypothetical protein LTS07_004059 [Exophiala sideris]KAK5037170.1 hypothetical protein LTR13_004975 [Exophiala sideris]KAK5062174.1 hypothetical protein LTR69_004532 [Exophiala sideris]KAK5182328.1 hypothetical protein LTR44_005339 [Eurotiomycetes sp. CCFEE 6388]